MRRANTQSHMDRLETLTAMLKSEGALTVQHLAESLEVSERTLFRDIAILRERGLPIDADKGRGGGIKLNRHWGVGRLSLEHQEIIDVLISVAIAESMGSSLFLGSLSSIRHKLMASFSAKQKEQIQSLRQRIHIGDIASPDVLASYNTNVDSLSESFRESIADLYSGFLEHKTVVITYVDAVGCHTKREIEPHFLYLSYPVWYVVAVDQLREDFRIFRCDRIASTFKTSMAFGLRPLDDFASILSENVKVRTL